MTKPSVADVLLIARTELIRRLRSRSALITAFIAPLAMAIVFGLMFSSTSSATFSIGVATDGDRSEAVAIVDELASASDTEAVTFVALGDRNEAVSAVDDGLVGSAIVIDDALILTVLTTPASPLSGQVGESIAASIAGRIANGGEPPVMVELTDLPVGGRELSAQAYFGASMAVLLLFFAVGLAARSILEDRGNRTLDRMLSGPTNIWSVLIGKVLAVGVLGVAGFLTVWIVTSLVFGATWGNPVGVIVLIVATVFALCGVATFLGGFANTPQQVDTITAVVTFGLALLGGNFTGPADAPAALRAVRRFTPNGRALEAFTELSVDASSVASIVGSLVVLVLFGLVFGGIGLTRLNRTVNAR